MAPQTVSSACFGLSRGALNPFRALKPLLILNLSDYVPKIGFPVAKVKGLTPLDLEPRFGGQVTWEGVSIGRNVGRPGGVSGYPRAWYRSVS